MNFFPSKVPEFFKKKSKKRQKNFLLVPLRCVHCARFDIFALVFLGNKVQNSQKKYRGMFKSTWKKLGTFDGKRITRKSYLGQPCNRPFNYVLHRNTHYWSYNSYRFTSGTTVEYFQYPHF